MTLAAAGLLSLVGYVLGVPLVTGRGGQTLEAYVILYLALFGVYLLAVVQVTRRPSGDRVVVAMILAFGLLFRLAMLPTPIVLSSDPYRYLWDGRVQRNGINPYRHAPADEALRPLRDPEIHPKINRPTRPTVYPPGAEIAFGLVAAVAPDSLLGWRLFVLACEVATGTLLLGLLRRMRVPASAVLVYAWAPLAVFEGVQAGHVDFVMLPLLLLALGWRQTDRPVRAGVALGLAVLVKLYPAVLLLAWWRRGDWKFPAAWVAVILAGYALYLPGAGPDVVGFLPRYFSSAEDFNIGLRLFLTGAIGLAIGEPAVRALGGLAVRVMHAMGYLDARVPLDQLVSPEETEDLRQALNMPSAEIGQLLLQQLGHETIRALAMLALFAILAAVLLRIGRRRSPGPVGVFRAGMAAAAAYLVLVPTALHAWYAAWILPFLAGSPSLAWFWFTGMVPLSYLKYAWEPAGLPLWVRLLEFLPLYGLLVWEWRLPPAQAPDHR
jgi:alpha-1,6-mannosyltransferase